MLSVNGRPVGGVPSGELPAMFDAAAAEIASGGGPARGAARVRVEVLSERHSGGAAAVAAAAASGPAAGPGPLYADRPRHVHRRVLSLPLHQGKDVAIC